MIGCGGLLVAGCVAGFLGYRWMDTEGRKLGADAANQGITQAINQTDLPADQKKRIISRVNQLSEDFKAGKVSMEDLGHVAEKLAESPLLPLGSIVAAKAQYIDAAKITAQEKDAAILQLHRYARGVFEKKITTEQVGKSVEKISVRQPGGKLELKQSLTTLELQAFIADLRQGSDAANIPNEKFEVDIAAELIAAIDEATKPKR